MGEICILHAPETWEFARQAAAGLAGEGHSVFRRENAPAEDHLNADAVIVVWSAALLSSPDMLDAARRALARRILVPISVGGVEPPGSFAHVLPIDLSGWQGDRNDPRWQFVRDEVDLAVRRNEAAAESAPVGERSVWAPPQVGARVFAPAIVAVAALAGVSFLLIPQRQAAEPDEAVVAAVQDGHARETGVETQSIPPLAGETAPASRTAAQEPASQESSDDAPVADNLRIAAVDRPVAVAAPVEPATSTTTDEAASERETIGPQPPDLRDIDEETFASAEIPDEALAEGDADPEEAEAVTVASLEMPTALPLPSPAADDFAGIVFRDCAACPDMAEIPAAPAETATLDSGLVLVNAGTSEPFALSRREVTFAEWNACVADQACRPVSDAGWGRDKRPVINVSFDDAQGYVAWLTAKTGRRYRLPTEAEWDLAAGASEASPSAANLGQGRAMTVPAGSFAPSVYGLYDMRGNVWEWVADCSPAPAGGADCSRHIIKGGAWNTPAAAGVTATKGAVEAGADVGFRVARDLS